jgi:hypothetical protein
LDLPHPEGAETQVQRLTGETEFIEQETTPATALFFGVDRLRHREPEAEEMSIRVFAADMRKRDESDMIGSGHGAVARMAADPLRHRLHRTLSHQCITQGLSKL